MRLRLDDHTRVPPFEQIRAQIALHVAAGRLKPGARLPTVRSLANQLDVAPNTIARAYRELIASNICVAAGRRGTFVSEAPPVAHQVAHRHERLSAAAALFAEQTNELGVPVDEALEAVIHALRGIVPTEDPTDRQTSDSVAAARR